MKTNFNDVDRQDIEKLKKKDQKILFSLLNNVCFDGTSRFYMGERQQFFTVWLLKNLYLDPTLDYSGAVYREMKAGGKNDLLKIAQKCDLKPSKIQERGDGWLLEKNSIWSVPDKFMASAMRKLSPAFLKLRGVNYKNANGDPRSTTKIKLTKLGEFIGKLMAEEKIVFQNKKQYWEEKEKKDVLK